MTHLPTPIEAVDLSVPSRAEVLVEPPRLRTARGGWSQVVLRVRTTGAAGRPTLRLPAFARSAAVSGVNVYQVLSAPVDFNTAAYVRQSGEPGLVQRVPRVLLPLTVGRDGTVDLKTVRDGDRGPVLVWVEFRAADTAAAGDAAGACDLLDGPAGEVLGSVPVTLSVADLSVADLSVAGGDANDRLRIAAGLDWSAAAATDPEAFADVRPRLLSRRDPACTAAVADLDAYVRLAHENGADLYVERAQPIVKWPPGQPPLLDWADFDAVAGPWLDGSAFADRRPVEFWPLPSPDGLDELDLTARGQYRAAAAEHFDGRRWSARTLCPVVLRTGAATLTDARAIELSAEARATLEASASTRVLLPMRDEQVPLASAENPSLVPAAAGDRLLTRAAGGVRRARGTPWPSRQPDPTPVLDVADRSVLHGTGDEQDVRSAAWLAFLRGARVVTCGDPLPSTSSPTLPVPADELPWFYPGSWYGRSGPLPTIQLKWLRQAQQDYAVLRQTAAADDRATAVTTCRLIAKPVDVAGSGADAPSQVTLLGGTTEGHACDGTRDLLVDRLVGRRHGDRLSPASRRNLTPLDLRSVRWFDAHQRPTPFATAVRWTWAGVDPAEVQGQMTEPPDPGPGNWITAKVDVGVYDPVASTAVAAAAAAADGAVTWTGNTLAWQTAGGWEPRPPTSFVPSVPACGVRVMPAVARFDLDRAGPATAGDRRPAVLTLVDGADGQSVDCPLVLPVATCQRLTREVTLDGDLGDWSAADAAWLARPLVRMTDRPFVQSGQARPAEGPTTLYTGWSDDELFVAFRVAGVSDAGLHSTRTFTDYPDGRAWGEDLCEVTVQPLYVDDATGPALHVVCKVGGESTERQPAPGAAWQPFEGAALRYAARVDANGVWRGELAIPWSAIAPARGRPTLLRFNFGQHVNATGESATWAGPVDRSRQVGMAGLLVLRDAVR